MPFSAMVSFKFSLSIRAYTDKLPPAIFVLPLIIFRFRSNLYTLILYFPYLIHF